MSQKFNVWGFISTRSRMLPNLYLLFCLLFSFHLILNLYLFMPIYHFLIPLLLLHTSCTIELIHKETLLLASFALYSKFSLKRKQISQKSLCCIYVWFIACKKILIEVYLNVELQYTKVISLGWCQEINKTEILFLIRYNGLNLACCQKYFYFYCLSWISRRHFYD